MLVSITRYPGPVTENILSSFRHAVQVKAMTSSVNWRNMYIVYSTDIMCKVYLSNIPATLMSKVSESHTWVVVNVLGLTISHLRLHLDHPGGLRRRRGHIDPHKLHGDVLWNLL